MAKVNLVYCVIGDEKSTDVGVLNLASLYARAANSDMYTKFSIVEVSITSKFFFFEYLAPREVRSLRIFLVVMVADALTVSLVTAPRW
jgi:hypothetical protein